MIIFSFILLKSFQFSFKFSKLSLSTGCCFFLSSVVNPFLYSLLSKRFRRGYQDLIRKIKLQILKIPLFVHPSNSQTSSSVTQNVKRTNPEIEPNKTTPSQQEREGLVNSMCCTGMMVKQSIYRWKTCSTRNQDNKKLKSQNRNDCQIEVSVYKDEIEMKNVNKKDKFDKYSDRESDGDIFYSVGSSIPITEKTTLFVSGQVYEQLSQSENDGPLRNSRSYSTSSNSRCFSLKRRASESNTKLLVYEDTLKKQKSKHNK